jgi:hypothetical protein
MGMVVHDDMCVFMLKYCNIVISINSWKTCCRIPYASGIKRSFCFFLSHRHRIVVCALLVSFTHTSDSRNLRVKIYLDPQTIQSIDILNIKIYADLHGFDRKTK